MDQELDINDLTGRIISRIEKFGTIEGFSNEELEEVLHRAKKILEPLPAMLELTAPIVVFGDIHGQLADLLKFVEVVGRPPKMQYLFLGDYVDRSTRSLEVIFWLLCNKIIHPSKVHLLRGNHEVRRVNAVYGFQNECVRKRSRTIWKILNDIFCEFPLCANINRKILCMHGGISPKIEAWSTLMEMKKSRVHRECEEGLAVDLLWSDPNIAKDEYKFNTRRGISCLFGESVVKSICQNLGIELIIRAHEVKQKGFEFKFNNRLLTIFSAPMYSALYANCASAAKISKTLKLKIETIKPISTYEYLRMEKDRELEKMNAFNPLDENSSKHCRYHITNSSFEAENAKVRNFVGDESMFGHETKNCKVPTQSSRHSSDEFLSLNTILKTSRSTKEENVTLSSLLGVSGSEKSKDTKDSDEKKDAAKKTGSNEEFANANIIPGKPAEEK